MDRRQKKTRTAIFDAFCALLSVKHYDKITVGEIIERADVGRATFYAHFETKEFLLKELCEELFCHIFDSSESREVEHYHIFDCDAPSSVFLHLLRHLEKNDRNILDLLTCANNDVFLRYFKINLKKLMKRELSRIGTRSSENVPESFMIDHIASSFVSAVLWWIENGMKETPEQLLGYFNATI